MVNMHVGHTDPEGLLDTTREHIQGVWGTGMGQENGRLFQAVLLKRVTNQYHPALPTRPSCLPDVSASARVHSTSSGVSALPITLSSPTM